jgi:hypothetical protein
MSTRFSDIHEIRCSSYFTVVEQARVTAEQAQWQSYFARGCIRICLCMGCLHLMSLDSCGCRENQPSKGYALLTGMNVSFVKIDAVKAYLGAKMNLYLYSSHLLP